MYLLIKIHILACKNLYIFFFGASIKIWLFRNIYWNKYVYTEKVLTEEIEILLNS